MQPAADWVDYDQHRTTANGIAIGKYCYLSGWLGNNDFHRNAECNCNLYRQWRSEPDDRTERIGNGFDHEYLFNGNNLHIGQRCNWRSVRMQCSGFGFDDHFNVAATNGNDPQQRQCLSGRIGNGKFHRNAERYGYVFDQWRNKPNNRTECRRKRIVRIGVYRNERHRDVEHHGTGRMYAGCYRPDHDQCPNAGNGNLIAKRNSLFWRNRIGNFHGNTKRNNYVYRERRRQPDDRAERDGNGDNIANVYCQYDLCTG
jgi:hypothetical protein